MVPQIPLKRSNIYFRRAVANSVAAEEGLFLSEKNLSLMVLQRECRHVLDRFFLPDSENVPNHIGSRDPL